MTQVHARALIAALGFTALTALSAMARAQQSFDLDWQAPTGCGSSAQTRARLTELLGEAPEAALKAPLSAKVRVIRVAPDRYRLELTVTREGGQRMRTLHAQTCGALSDAAALILALAINPEAPKLREVMAREPSAAPMQDFLPAPSPRPPPVRVTAAELASEALVAPVRESAEDPFSSRPRLAPAPEPFSTQSDPEVSWRLGAGAGALFDTGVLPEATFGGFVAVVGEVDRFRFGLTGSALLEREGHAEGNKGADLSAWLISTRGCYALVNEGWDVGPCLGIELGRISGTGFGVSAPGEGSGPWLALMGGGGVGLRLEPVRLFLMAEAVVPPARPRFVLENVGEVHRPAALGARVSAGAELYFW